MKKRKKQSIHATEPTNAETPVHKPTDNQQRAEQTEGSHEEVTKENRLARFFKKTWQSIVKVLKYIWTRKDVIRDVVKNKHRFVVIDNDTYKEKFSFQLSGINLFVTIGIVMIVLVVLTTVLIAFTPLREYIPGYTNTEMSNQTYRNALIIDSLEQKLTQQEQMIGDIKAIMLGQDPSTLRQTDTSAKNNDQHVHSATYTHSNEDSMLRAEIESIDQYSLQTSESGSNTKSTATDATPVTMQLFFTPMKGKVISPFDPKINHYGVDVAGNINEAVKAAMNGTVIFSSFTVETGYVIAVQHDGNYFTVYKHNSALLKHEGDIVRAGEPLAYMGNSGTLSTGPHLHFELWHNGRPLNPLQYISF